MKKLSIILVLFIAVIGVVSCDNSSTTTQQTTQTTTEETTTLPASSGKTVSSIEITQNSIYQTLNQPFDFSTLEVTATYSDSTTAIVDAMNLSVRGYDQSRSGSQTVFVVYENQFYSIEVIVIEEGSFYMTMEYYADANGLTGQALSTALYTILHNGFTPLNYGDARDILQESDEDPNNPDNIILIYTNISVSSTWDPDVWNREHVWPQSRLTEKVDYPAGTPSIATDVHNLKPADPGENSRRSNDYFGNSTSNYLYIPRASVRGDVARILFYMSTMYYELTLNDNEYSGNSSYSMGLKSLLLEWHEADPVDDFERNRNDVIYSYQGNRNPFIDYPELVELIWE